MGAQAGFILFVLLGTFLSKNWDMEMPVDRPRTHIAMDCNAMCAAKLKQKPLDLLLPTIC